MSSYDYSVFKDGSKISNNLLVFHLEQVYDMLVTWEGKGMLFFCLHLAKFGFAHDLTNHDLTEYKRILRNADLVTSPERNKVIVLATSFKNTLLCIDEQNDLYNKLFLAITQQRKFSHKLIIKLNQFNSATGEYLDPVEAKSDSDFDLPSKMVDFLKSL